MGARGGFQCQLALPVRALSLRRDADSGAAQASEGVAKGFGVP